MVVFNPAGQVLLAQTASASESISVSNLVAGPAIADKKDKVKKEKKKQEVPELSDNRNVDL